MRPQGVGGALVAIAVGAILTYAVRFTVSGVSIHTVGVIIMLAGVVALVILLIRTVSGSRRRDYSGRAPLESDLGPDGSYLQDPPGGASQVETTRVSTEVYAAPGRQADDLPRSAVVRRRTRTLRR
jgi:hypothetical protein